MEAMIERPEGDRELKLFQKTHKEGSRQQEMYQTQVINNIKLIKDCMMKMRPDSLVVEMCDDRYERWLADVVAHPNYLATISDIHQILNKEPEKLKAYDQVDVEDSNMEYLVGIDICSYRIPCKTILGDRSYKITKKRYEGKR